MSSKGFLIPGYFSPNDKCLIWCVKLNCKNTRIFCSNESLNKNSLCDGNTSKFNENKVKLCLPADQQMAASRALCENEINWVLDFCFLTQKWRRYSNVGLGCFSGEQAPTFKTSAWFSIKLQSQQGLVSSFCAFKCTKYHGDDLTLVLEGAQG